MISVLRSCHGFWMSDGVHPFGSYGRLARCAQPPDCCWTFSRHECEHRTAVFAHHARMRIVTARIRRVRSLDQKPLNKRFRSKLRAKTRAVGRAQKHLATNIVLLEQRLVSRLVPLLEVVEERTAGRDQLQEATTRMVVLHVGLEMVGEVVDAFRQDRDLNLGRAGVAGLGGIGLDDFRFAFCGNRHRQFLSLRPGLAVRPVRLNTRLGMISPLPTSASAKRRPATVT